MSDDASSDGGVNPAGNGDANWSLLPHRPIEFFGLAEGFGRSDLKRAYNKLLRIYKPDKFPDEFQRLRAAYEKLDTSLRYGTPQVTVDPELQSQWLAQAEVPTPPSELNTTSISSTPELSPLEQLLVRLDETSPKDLYRELQSQTVGSPLEFYALAILSDADHSPDEAMFAKWLIAGLIKHPNEPSLMRLLGDYLQTKQITEASLEVVLINASRVITTDHFYFYTERSFDRLTQLVPWDKFEQVLEACRGNINDHRVRGQVVFSCHLLRRAAWLAPEEATLRLVDYIEEHAQYLGSGLEYDYEFNIRLVAYVKTRDAFAARGPFCKLIDEALRAYCLEPGDASDRKVIGCQTRIAQHPELLFAEFPYPGEDNDAQLSPWVWACDEVLGRLQTEAEQPSVQHRHAVTLKLLKQIDSTFPASPLKVYNMTRWFLYALGYTIAGMLPITVVSMATVFASSEYELAIATTTLVTSIVLVLLFHYKIRPRYLDTWASKRLQRLVCRHYSDWWRSMIARFHAATHLSYYDVRQASIDLIQHRHGELNVSTWFSQLYSVDVAMVVYASAVKFLR